MWPDRNRDIHRQHTALTRKRYVFGLGSTSTLIKRVVFGIAGY